MAKKKVQHQTSFMTVELQNILAGGILITLGVLMFLSTTEASIIGKYFTLIGVSLFSLEWYRWIFSPIVIVLGIMILVKRASWSGTRLAGLLLYFLSLTSLFGFLQGESIALFDLHEHLVTFLGRTAAILTLLVLFFASLWMTLRISYRALLSRVRESVPSLSTVRDAVLSPEEEESPKKSERDSVYKKKAEELERKLADIHRSKEKKEEKPPVTGKTLIANALS